MQVIWTLMHYGTPADLSLFDDALCDQLAAFAKAVAEALQPWHRAAPVYNIVNEIGFTAWPATSTNLLYPYRGSSDTELAQVKVTQSNSGWCVRHWLRWMRSDGLTASQRVSCRSNR